MLRARPATLSAHTPGEAEGEDVDRRTSWTLWWRGRKVSWLQVGLHVAAAVVVAQAWMLPDLGSEEARAGASDAGAWQSVGSEKRDHEAGYVHLVPQVVRCHHQRPPPEVLSEQLAALAARRGRRGVFDALSLREWLRENPRVPMRNGVERDAAELVSELQRLGRLAFAWSPDVICEA
eukprot:Hpha_TRINITY_DN10022_c0_g1::TRINITY_DN10022_c0_g1_i2::g.84062::m.84062